MGKHILFQTGIRRLGSKEKKFFYRYPGMNETVREERVLTRIENLKVPPGLRLLNATITLRGHSVHPRHSTSETES